MRITPDQARRISELTVKKQVSFFDVCAMVVEAGLRIIEEEYDGQGIEMQLPISRNKDFQTIGEIND